MSLDELQRENLQLKTDIQALEKKLRVAEAKGKQEVESQNQTLKRYKSLLTVAMASIVVLVALMLVVAGW